MTDPGETRSLRALVRSDVQRHGSLAAALPSLGFHATLLYRLSHWLFDRGFDALAKFVQWWGLVTTGADLSRKARIGPGLAIYHPQAILVGPGVVMGEGCNLYQGCALMSDSWVPQEDAPYPELEDRVHVGAGAKVLGGVHLYHDALIAPNSVVMKDVPPGFTALGVPARVMDPSFRHG